MGQGGRTRDGIGPAVVAMARMDMAAVETRTSHHQHGNRRRQGLPDSGSACLRLHHRPISMAVTDTVAAIMDHLLVTLTDTRRRRRHREATRESSSTGVHRDRGEIGTESTGTMSTGVTGIRAGTIAERELCRSGAPPGGSVGNWMQNGAAIRPGRHRHHEHR